VVGFGVLKRRREGGISEPDRDGSKDLHSKWNLAIGKYGTIAFR